MKRQLVKLALIIGVAGIMQIGANKMAHMERAHDMYQGNSEAMGGEIFVFPMVAGAGYYISERFREEEEEE